jgi:aminomethyltransferase
LLPEGRAPVRAGTGIFSTADSIEPIGIVTSGGFGPTVNRPVAMGYLPSAMSRPETVVFADVRGQRLPVAIATLPFVPARFKRRPPGNV